MLKRFSYLCLAVSLVAGCSTIRRAHEAQDAAAVSVAVSAAKPSFPAAATLPELVDFALTNRPSVMTARLAVEDARLRVKEIDANAPVFSSTPWNALDMAVSLGYSESAEGQYFKDLDFRTERGAATGAVSLDLLVYDFGRHAAEGKAQAERVIAAEESLAETVNALCRDVVTGVASLREAAALRTVAETNVVTAAAHLEQAERREAEGESKKLDVLQARLLLAQAAESLVSASNAVVTAEATLVQMVGADARGLQSLGSDGFALERGRLVPVATDGLFAFAETNAPSLKIARARAKAASADVSRAIADLFPTVSASTSLSWTDPLWYFRWGFSGAQSLFTGFRKTTGVDRAVVALQSSVASLREAELTLRRELELALAARENAAEMRRTAADTRRTAEENFALVDEQYRIGEANRVDYADALKALAEARGSEARAEAAALRAEATIYQLIGQTPEYL